MTVDDLESVRVSDRDMVGSQTDEVSILLVYLMDMLAPVSLGCPIGQPGVAELGDPGAWNVANVVRIDEPWHKMDEDNTSRDGKQEIEWMLLDELLDHGLDMEV
jgi:hypothetical protein